MKKVLSSLIFVLMFGGATLVYAQSAQNLTVRLNKQAKATRSKLTVKFLAVEDSRCPRGVDCVWAGNAVVTVRLTSAKGKSQTFELNTNLDAKAVRFEGWEIKLGDLTPYPATNVRIDPNGYAAKFVITKLK